MYIILIYIYFQELLWSVGLNSDVPLINLTTKNRTLIAYSCSHIVIIYNYETKEALNLQGHVRIYFFFLLYYIYIYIIFFFLSVNK